MNKIYGYGIIDQDGNPYFPEENDGQSKNREPLDKLVKMLNEVAWLELDDITRYRVVRLYRVAKK